MTVNDAPVAGEQKRRIFCPPKAQARGAGAAKERPAVQAGAGGPSDKPQTQNREQECLAPESTAKPSEAKMMHIDDEVASVDFDGEFKHGEEQDHMIDRSVAPLGGIEAEGTVVEQIASAQPFQTARVCRGPAVTRLQSACKIDRRDKRECWLPGVS